LNLPDQRTPLFSINGRGFRGPEVGKKSNDRKRVILVGGSAAFGTGLDGDSETFAAQLEKSLPNTEVVNAAVIGHRSGNELAYIACELVDLEPDLLIALDGWNDFSQADQVISGRWLDVAGADQVAIQLYISSRVVNSGFFERITYVPRLVLSNTYQRLHQLGRQELTPPSPPPPGQSIASIEEVSQVYAQNLVKMKRTAVAFGSDFLCLLQASRRSMYPELPKRSDPYRRFRTQAKRVLDSHGIAWIDLN
jgi:hypothetical protein